IGSTLFQGIPQTIPVCLPGVTYVLNHYCYPSIEPAPCELCKTKQRGYDDSCGADLNDGTHVGQSDTNRIKAGLVSSLNPWPNVKNAIVWVRDCGWSSTPPQSNSLGIRVSSQVRELPENRTN